VITTASQIPDIVGPEYKKAFEYLGAKNCNILDIKIVNKPTATRLLREPML
jgi:cyanophycinase-like exopeptidase